MHKVPGTHKTHASFEDKTVKLPIMRGKSMANARVEDEGYSYTGPEYPGHIEKDPNLTRAEGMHVRKS